ncbi:MAG TPA: MmcQ/YjbR family DNA-binding protein [Solirubrobacterales bacterium]|nr:MmcQ/YjbR family DNA-binding protein [Solirubrobacterales bacterium]
MATWEDVAKIANALPEVAEEPSYGERAWKVRKKTFAWERPLRAKEVEHLGGFEPDGAAPTGEILAVRVADEEAKQALVSSEPEIFFTTSHFDGYPAVLIRLERIARPELEELLIEAWLAKAPKRVAAAFLAERD